MGRGKTKGLQEKEKDMEGKTEARAFAQCQQTPINTCTSRHGGAPWQETEKAFLPHVTNYDLCMFELLQQNWLALV